MRSVGTRQEGIAPTADTGECQFKVGDRVVHPKFGRGIVERIEALTTDHKVVVSFEGYGSKTLLAKFAKLSKA
jgi:DNA helicase-2/ATP-dependent DNA helicase PcrA